MRKSILGLGLLVGVLAFTANAQFNPKDKKAAPDLKAGIVRETKYKDAAVEKMLKAIAPALKEQLEAGRSVTIEGVGTFQVVRVAEYKDLKNGRPATFPARNYVEFVPVDSLNDSANTPGAVPARTVRGYEFVVNPDHVQGQKTENRKTFGIRTR